MQTWTTSMPGSAIDLVGGAEGPLRAELVRGGGGDCGDEAATATSSPPASRTERACTRADEPGPAIAAFGVIGAGR